MVRFTQQGCLGQPQKEAGKENRKRWCFPSDQLLYFPDLIFCPDALSQMGSEGRYFMALGSTAFPDVPGLPSTEKEMNICYHLPPAINYHILWLFWGNDLMSLILPLPKLLPVTARGTARCWASQQLRSLLGFLRTLSLLCPTGKIWGMKLLPSPLSLVLGRKSPNDPDFRKTPLPPRSSVFEIHDMFQEEFFQHGHCQ